MIHTTAQWEALQARRDSLAATSLREMFAADPARARSLSLDVDGLHADLSKHLIDASTIYALVDLATAAGLPEKI